jgi:YHS domain-containing protein
MKKIKLYYRQCSQCKKGMSCGYIMHDGTYYFCTDECVSKKFGRKKVFTTLDDWNNNGPGLTWKQFQASWDDLDDRSYAYEWQLDVFSYTAWYDGDTAEDEYLYDLDGKEYWYEDVVGNDSYEFVEGEEE